MTEQGRAYWEQLQQRIYDFYAQGLKGFGFDDVVSILHYLNKLQINLAEVDLQAGAADSDQS